MKKIKIEDILCIFLILCPILDVVSFLFRNHFNTSLSPSTFIRPIIPAIIIIYLFFKEKFKLKIMIVGLIYFAYGVIHLLIYKNILTTSAYGTLVHEAQYIINYSYMILNLFIYLFVFKNKDTGKLNKSIVISIFIYITSIYISIITGTSSSTYIEESANIGAMGYKGWFESGNSISAILTLSMFVLLPLINKKEYKIKIIILSLLIGLFLTTLIGTRVGLYGFVLSVFAYVGSNVFVNIAKKAKINKKQILVALVLLVVVISGVGIFGSNTLKRRQNLKEVESEIIDTSTGEISYIGGDVLKVKKGIDNNEILESEFSKPQQKSILSLYDYAKKIELSNSNRRVQQIMYHTYLLVHQKSFTLTLFGNGYLAHLPELILEMELPAFFFNFGIIGFALYIIPFLTILIYSLVFAVKNIRKIDVEYLMLAMGAGLAFVLSTLSGYTFFNSSTMMIIIVINVLLYKKILEIKKGVKTDETIEK